MGERVSVEDLRARATAFFEKVVDVLVERNTVRGDSYLEIDLGDFAAMFRDKGGRIRTAACQYTNLTSVHKELIDSVIDEAGYSALLSIWLVEKLGITDEEWDVVFRRTK